MRAGLYQRVSNDNSGRSRSCEQQNAAGRAAAADNGWKVVASYDEPDRSASRFATRDRPVWQRLRNDVVFGRLDVVVLWEPSRGDRKLATWATFLDDCREHDVRIFITKDDRLYDLSHDGDWKTMASDGVDSTHESNKTSTRSKRGLAALRSEGRPVGRVPYGYLRTYDPLTRIGTQVADPDTADAVVGIVDRIAGGTPISEVRTWLHDSGVVSPGGSSWWPRRTITDVVNYGWCYVGRYRDGSAAGWPALVDDTVWFKARKVLARNRPTGAARPGRARWMLSYLALCDNCDSVLAAKIQPRVNRGEPIYRCLVSRAGCAWIDCSYLDRVVTSSVLWFASQPWARAALEPPAMDGSVADGLRAELEALSEDYASGVVSPSVYARVATDLESRLANCASASEGDVVVAAGLLGDPVGIWEGLSLAGKRAAVASLYTVRVRPGRELALERVALKLQPDIQKI